MPSNKLNKQSVIVGDTYQDFPELYDFLYQRFLKTIPHFVDLVEKQTPSKGRILDLAAGTGEVSIPLLKRRYRVVSVDLHEGMLRQLKRKAKNTGAAGVQTKVSDMTKVTYRNEFDTVCVRQAINYLANRKELKQGLIKMYDALRVGGKLVFNAPNFNVRKRTYPSMTRTYKKGEMIAFVVERNTLRGRALEHQQDALVVNDKKNTVMHYIDSNTFTMYTKQEFSNALESAGFLQINFSGSDGEPCRLSSKTLYCVATK